MVLEDVDDNACFVLRRDSRQSYQNNTVMYALLKVDELAKIFVRGQEQGGGAVARSGTWSSLDAWLVSAMNSTC